MSDGAIFEYQPTTSALEVSEQRLGGRLLHLVPDDSLPDEAYYPYYVTGEATTTSPTMLKLATTASAETVDLVIIEPTDNQSEEAIAFEPEKAKEILRNEAELKYQDKLTALLIYAWNTTGTTDPSIPIELVRFVPEDLEKWFKANAEFIDQLIEHRNTLPAIYDETDAYEASSPFIQNAVDIHDLAINRGMRKEGLIIEISARLLLLEAIRAKNIG